MSTSGRLLLDTNAAIGDIVLPVGTLKEPALTKTISVDLNLNAARDVMEKYKLSIHQIRNRFTMFNSNYVQLEEKRDE